MDEENTSQEPQETSGEQGNGGYSFIKQTIKKRPVSKRSVLLRVIAVVLSAAVFGAVAAFVFAALRPVAETAIHGAEEDPRVSIPADDEPVAVSSVVSASSIETDSSSSSESEVATSSEDTEVEEDVEELPPTGITLEQYRQLELEMIATAEAAEQSLVQVTGISSELDYFLQDHENRTIASGLVIAKTDTEIFILTDLDAVKDAERIAITFFDESTAEAAMIRGDENTGLVVLSAPAESITEAVSLALEETPLGNSYSVLRGEPVIALGNPAGVSEAVVCGMITSTENRVHCIDGEYQTLVTDIGAGGSYSSGVLVDLSGNIIGIITRRVAGQNGDTISALAISRIKPLIERLSNNESAPYAGLRGQTVTAAISEISGIPRGFLVTGVEPDSPAMLAGIKELDVITGIADSAVENADNYMTALRAQTIGQTVQVVASRQGAGGYAEIEFSLTIGES